MSFIKRYLDDLQAVDEMHNWIRENGSIFMEEGGEEWNELKEDYLKGNTESRVVSIFEDWEDDSYESEMQWTKEQKAFPTFIKQMDEIKGNLSFTSSVMNLKMNYSFSFTIMESCLEDMLRGVVFSNDVYLLNSIKNVNELKSMKASLLDVYQTEDFIRKIVMKTLAGSYTYHNINVVLSLYKNIINEPLPDSIKDKIDGMKSLIEIRHDIVHRNGFTTAGHEHVLDMETVHNAIGLIIEFVAAIKDYMSTAEAKRVFS